MQPWNEDTFVSVLPRTNTSSNSCTFEYIYESNEIRVARLSAESFLALVGVLFNIVICVINLKHSTINAPIRMYIRNVALADIGVLLLGFPFAVAKEQQGTQQWVFGEITCRYVYPLTETFYAVSTWSLVAMAVQRYRIIKPKPWRRRNESGAIRVLVVLWITPLLIISLPILLASHYGSTCGKGNCFVRWPTSSATNNIPAKVHSFSLLSLLFIFPLGVVLWSYYKVSVSPKRGSCARKKGRPRLLRLRSDNSETTNPSLISEQDEARQQECSEAKRFLTPFIVIFVISTIPMNFLRVNFIFSSSVISLEKYLVLFNVSIMLNVCNSVGRPFIYYLVSQDIRIACKVLVEKLKDGFRRGWGERHDEMVPLQEIRHSRTDYKETIL